jgi:hypothetical protein
VSGTLRATLSHAGDLIFPNNAIIQWGNSGGVNSPVLQKFGNGVYLDNYSGDLNLRAGAAEALVASLILKGDGRLYGTHLHNNANPVTGTATQYVASGTYTPTPFAGTNMLVGNIIPAQFQWIRVGNVVSFSGSVQADPTAAGIFTSFGLSLPIASNFTSATNLGGGGGDLNGNSNDNINLSADAANDRMTATLFPTGAGNVTYTVSGTYLIL